MPANRRPWIIAAVLVLVALVPYADPFMARFRLVHPDSLVRTFIDPFRGRPHVPLWTEVRPMEREGHPGVRGRGTGQTPEEQEAATSTATPGQKPRSPAEEASGREEFLADPSHALKGFYQAVEWAERGVGVIRILHLGDSVVTGDLITAEARARLREAYGDGGPGWVYPARPWEWYTHLGLTVKDSDWKIYSPLLNTRRDRRYGLAGLAFSSTSEAETVLHTDRHHPFSRLKLHYLAQPDGGSVIVRVDGQPPAEVSTAGERGPAVQEVPLAADSAHSVSLTPKGDGEITLYGLVLERYGPGVAYDAVGSNGGAIHHLALINAGDWIEALRLRSPDLVILAFGTNETAYQNVPGPAYAADYREVVRRIREALPQVSILIMGPMDRGEHNETGEIISMPKVVQIVEAQRAIARELDCAFFDTFRAMGGEGAAGRWYASRPRLMTADFTHPTRIGADALAKLLVDSLERGYAAFREGRASGGPEEHGGVGEAGPEGSYHRR
jgi:lysophospholipase L1-like esterase